jgi:ERCC4-type nuclease
MQLWCDERERNGPIPHLPKLDWIHIKTLHVGDFAITCGDNVLCVLERKSWKDLSASLKDGRYTHQIENMQRIECQRFFIIEGKMGFKPEHEIGGIAFYKLEAAVRKLIMLGFGVIRTKNEQHTAEQMVMFAQQYEREFPEKFKCDITGNSDQILKKRVLSRDEILDKIWTQLPGISPTLLPVIKPLNLKYFIMNCGQPDLIKTVAAMKYLSGRKIGEKNATKICSTANDEKILSAFPGISAATAKYILSHTNLRDFVQLTPYSMSNCKKSPTKTIGVALADKITDLLKD